MKALSSFCSRHIALLVLISILLVDVLCIFEVARGPIFGLQGIFLKYPLILPIAFMIELIGCFFFYQSVFIAPIHSLRADIARFLAGGQSPSNTKGKKTFNPDLDFVRIFFGKSLEILKNFKEEFQSGRVLRSEVELASELQKKILKKTNVHIPSLDIVANTKSASEVGGDSYDIIECGDNYYVYLGDVTGHGVASGFVMIMVNALISGFSKMITSGAEILAKTNEVLKPRTKSNMLMTLLLVRWNELEKKLYMTGAGHEYLVIYKKSKNAVFKVQSGGVALGMTRDISKVTKELQVSFDPGDILVMYTDGITEARNGRMESCPMFGIDRLLEVVASTPKKTAQGVFNHITTELSKFMGYQHRQFDDITLITAHYRGEEIITDDAPEGISKEFITEWNWS